LSVDATTYGELTQPFRWEDRQDAANLAAFPLARSVEAVSAFSDMAGLKTVHDERFELLAKQRRRFLVTVKGADYVVASSFAGQAPGAILKATRWGLSAGRRVLIVKFETDYGADVTRLLVWG
jgi:hypothetical protein